jgi:hypothetical protein
MFNLCRLGVSEICRYDGRSLIFYSLQDGQYLPCERFIALLSLKADGINYFLELRFPGAKTSLPVGKIT